MNSTNGPENEKGIPSDASTPEAQMELIFARIAHWLPIQGPLKDFVHHNTLHAFQHVPFHEALRLASRAFGAKSYLSANQFREAFRRGEIAPDIITRILTRENKTRDWLFAPADWEQPVPLGFCGAGLRRLWESRYGINLDRVVHPFLFRMIGNFLDQGISIWRMPHAHDRFWNAMRRLVGESRLPLSVLHDPQIRPLLALSPSQALSRVLPQLVSRREAYERYLLETCLSHPGWSGMVAVVEANPTSLLDPRRISLLEVTALELILELGHLIRILGPGFEPLPGDITETELKSLPEEDTTKRQRLLQEAFEETYYRDVLWGVERNLSRRATFPRPASHEDPVQVLFCIDDRSSSIRRHLEETSSGIETYGTAGFFGVDFYFQAAGSEVPTQHCPVVIRPKHLVREKSDGPFRQGPSTTLLTPATHTLIRGWLLAQTVGIVSLLRLALNVLKPGMRLLGDRALSTVETSTELTLLREGDARTEDGFWLGYSLQEMADRVENVLRGIGLPRDFAPLLVVLGHGSSSANNPHYAAYDCGACAGRAGAPNARSFAWMANHPDVRMILAARGIEIPDRTRFVGGLFDTSRDEVTYYDENKISESHRARLRDFHAKMRRALEKNAQERIRRFELAPRTVSSRRAHSHVRERSESIFEPRPELNHATNALCIVGRRALTKGVFLDRRAFLNSYDPMSDPDGEILGRTLNAVIPVCGGINLEYYFSRIDENVYGAGTKLPHNVRSLLGVSNGLEGDLRTGLPTQMTEIHDPLRLLILVEQEPEICLTVLGENPALFEWVRNEWVHFAAVSPSSLRFFRLLNGDFRMVESPPVSYTVPEKTSSLAITANQSGNIRVHFVRGAP